MEKAKVKKLPPSSHQGQLALRKEKGNKNIAICDCGRYYICKWSKCYGYETHSWERVRCTTCQKALSQRELIEEAIAKEAERKRMELFKQDGRIRTVWKR